MFASSRIIHEHSYRLPIGASVFQAEILAIFQAARWLISNPNQRYIKICVDSQAALLALCAQDIKSKLVAKTVETLNLVGARMEIRLVWVKAHVGTAGNEHADMLAKASVIFR